VAHQFEVAGEFAGDLLPLGVVEHGHASPQPGDVAGFDEAADLVPDGHREIS
jgi:hypothetical protein